MEVFRIVDYRYKSDLSGKGAGLYGGRWNRKDEYVLYTTSSVSLACLELLVNVDLSYRTPNYVLLTIEVPDEFHYKALNMDELPTNWRSRDQYTITRELGSNWYNELQEGMLKVPSAVIPQEHNFVINVFHPIAKELKITSTEPFIFDKRLLK